MAQKPIEYDYTFKKPIWDEHRFEVVQEERRKRPHKNWFVGGRRQGDISITRHGAWILAGLLGLSGLIAYAKHAIR